MNRAGYSENLELYERNDKCNQMMMETGKIMQKVEMERIERAEREDKPR